MSLQELNPITQSDISLLPMELNQIEWNLHPGTVGCVCMFHGHVAAATSTGGLTNKMAGRVGTWSAVRYSDGESPVWQHFTPILSFQTLSASSVTFHFT